MNKLMLKDDTVYTVLLCLYVADPATLHPLPATVFWGLIFLWEQFVHSSMDNISIITSLIWEMLKIWVWSLSPKLYGALLRRHLDFFQTKTGIFKPEQHVFLMLIRCFLCLKLEREKLNIERKETESCNIKKCLIEIIYDFAETFIPDRFTEVPHRQTPRTTVWEYSRS